MNQSSNISNNSASEDNMNNEQLITTLFNSYVSEGGAPRITSFRTHLNTLLSTHIKPLTGGSSGKSGDGSSWRSDQKARFSGRGMKWVFVSTDSVTTSLDDFDKRGIDTINYRAWIQQEGRAWVRYSGPRLLQGKPAAAFELRTLGSTIDQPKELHLILDEDLDEEIELMRTTPYALRLEELVTAEEEVEETSEPEEVVNDEESELLQEITGMDFDDDDLEDDDDL
tara:strand:+ start:430 stop:1107 length:678 start_codon:yes stop_codon:yes gene_type:complete